MHRSTNPENLVNRVNPAQICTIFMISKIIDSDAPNTPWPATMVPVRQRPNPENLGNRVNPAQIYTISVFVLRRTAQATVGRGPVPRRRSRGTGPRATVSGTVSLIVGRGPVPRHATIVRKPARSLKRSRGTGPRATVSKTAFLTVGRGPVPRHANRRGNGREKDTSLGP